MKRNKFKTPDVRIRALFSLRIKRKDEKVLGILGKECGEELGSNFRRFLQVSIFCFVLFFYFWSSWYLAMPELPSSLATLLLYFVSPI